MTGSLFKQDSSRARSEEHFFKRTARLAREQNLDLAAGRNFFLWRLPGIKHVDNLHDERVRAGIAQGDCCGRQRKIRNKVATDESRRESQ